VFSFFTEPALYVRWKGRLATLDPRPGGIYRVNIDGTRVARGEFVEVSPHRRIVFTWGWEDPSDPVQPGTSTVEVEFTPDGAGTLLRLVHRDLPEESTSGQAEGWDHFLPHLVAVAGGTRRGNGG